MPVMPDHWIRQMAAEAGMITPFEEKLQRQGVISYGLSSYGYDARVAEDFKIFTNVDNDSVALFIAHGADLTVRNKKGKSVFQAAKEGGPLRQEALRKAVQELKKK